LKTDSLLLSLLAAVLALVAVGLVWLGRRRQQRARDEAARREAQNLAVAKAHYAARAQQVAADTAAQAAQEAEARRQATLAAREQAERDAQARQQSDRLAREAAEAERRAAEARDAAREQAQREELIRQESERLARQAREAQEAEASARRAAEAEREEMARRAAEQQAQEPAHEAPPAEASTRELRADETLVLVADDSKIVRVKISRLLASHGYRVALADSGEQALAQMAAERPHLLITDVEMPGIDGFELTRRVRAAADTAALPVVMITSSDDKQDEAAAAGVTQLLGKPYPEEALIAAIERARVAVRVPA
jgi:CheY-like chemotaxis protein